MLVEENVNYTAAGSSNLFHWIVDQLFWFRSAMSSSPLNRSLLYILIVIFLFSFWSKNGWRVKIFDRRLGRVHHPDGKVNGGTILIRDDSGMIQVWCSSIYSVSNVINLKKCRECPSLLRDYCGEEILVACHCRARDKRIRGDEQGLTQCGQVKKYWDRSPEYKKLHADQIFSSPVCHSH